MLNAQSCLNKCYGTYTHTHWRGESGKLRVCFILTHSIPNVLWQFLIKLHTFPNFRPPIRHLNRKCRKINSLFRTKTFFVFSRLFFQIIHLNRSTFIENRRWNMVPLSLIWVKLEPNEAKRVNSIVSLNTRDYLFMFPFGLFVSICGFSDEIENVIFSCSHKTSDCRYRFRYIHIVVYREFHSLRLNRIYRTIWCSCMCLLCVQERYVYGQQKPQKLIIACGFSTKFLETTANDMSKELCL